MLDGNDLNTDNLLDQLVIATSKFNYWKRRDVSKRSLELLASRIDIIKKTLVEINQTNEKKNLKN